MKQKVVLMLILTIVLGLFTLKFTKALFSASANSNNNSFATAQSFATATPLPTETPFPTLTPSPTPTPAFGDVVINELMWMGSSKGSSDEWIELRNTTGRDIDISNWQITKWIPTGTAHEDLMYTIPASSIISSGGFYLISQKSNADSGSALNVNPDRVDSNIALNNSGLQIRLFVNNWNSGGVLIDTAGDKSTPLAGTIKVSTPKQFYSMERNFVYGDGTLGINWHTATTSVGFDVGADVENKGTPKSANSS